MVFLILIAAACGACRASSNARIYDAEQLAAYVREQGLEAGKRPVCWSDPAGRTVFVIGRTVSAPSSVVPSSVSSPLETEPSTVGAGRSLVLLSADRNEPLIMDLQGIDLRTQWIDATGKVWDLPAFAAGATIDRSSGLFLRCEPSPSRGFSVGRMGRADGWMFSGEFPTELPYGAHVKARGADVIVCENWHTKVQGAPTPRAHYWVYSPDPQQAGKYVQTDSYWQESLRLVMTDEVLLDVDGDWLGQRMRKNKE